MPSSTFNAKSVTAAEARKTVRAGIVVDDTVQKQFKKLGESMQRRVVDTVRLGIQRGEPTGVIARRISGGVIDGVAVPGVAKLTRVQASSLVHSAVISASVKDRLAVFRENSDIIKAIQQVSTLDNRTTETCIAYSNATWDATTLEPIGHSLPFDGGPPRHHNCRSVIVPVVAAPEELGIKTKEKIPPEVRASMDGQVAGDITFRDFLKGKPKEFAEDLLGPEKAKLFLSGKINEKDLLNSAGEPVSPEQLLKQVKSGVAPANYRGTGFTKIELDEQAQVMFDTDFEKLGFAQRKEVLKASRAGSLPLPQLKSVGAAQVSHSQFENELARLVSRDRLPMSIGEFHELMKMAEFDRQRLMTLQSAVKRAGHIQETRAKFLNTIREALTVARKSQVDKFLKSLKSETFALYRKYQESNVWLNEAPRSSDTFNTYAEYRRWSVEYDRVMQRASMAEARQSVQNYAGAGYHGLNAALRGGKEKLKGTGYAEFFRKMQAAFRAFDKAVGHTLFERDTVLFRGVPDSAFRNPPPGKVIIFKGFVSTSTNPMTSSYFVKQGKTSIKHMYEIVVPKGSRFVLTGFNLSEQEVLFDSGSKFLTLGNRYQMYELSGGRQLVHITRLVYLG